MNFLRKRDIHELRIIPASFAIPVQGYVVPIYLHATDIVPVQIVNDIDQLKNDIVNLLLREVQPLALVRG